MSVAESIVTLGPMTQLGCLSASSRRDGGQLRRGAAAERAARAGQQDLLGRQQRVVAGRDAGATGRRRGRPSRHWKMALCSLSTGRMRARRGAAPRPARRARRPPCSPCWPAPAWRPPRASARLARRPAAPTMPFSTTSSSPARAGLGGGRGDQLGDHPRRRLCTRQRARAAPPRRRRRVVEADLCRRRSAAAAASSGSTLRWAASAATHQLPATPAATSIAWRPIEPVAPRITTRRRRVRLAWLSLKRSSLQTAEARPASQAGDRLRRRRSGWRDLLARLVQNRDHVVGRHGGEDQRVEAVEHAAVAGEEAAGVLDLRRRA